MPEVTVEKTKNYLIVKIPLKATEEGRAEFSPRAQKIVDSAIQEGMEDIEAGRVSGPFRNMKEFKSSLRKAKR